MIPFAVLNGDITEAHKCIFTEVQWLLATIQVDPKDKCKPNCHDVCRRLARAFHSKLEYVRGHFTQGYDHSWLRIKDSDVIIDAYPWASSGPFMVTLAPLSPWASLYIPKGKKNAAVATEG